MHQSFAAGSRAPQLMRVMPLRRSADVHTIAAAAASVLSGAFTPDRHSVADGVHAGPAPAAQATGNPRSRLAVAGQNLHGCSPPEASGAASAQRAHNGDDGGSLAVTQMCIKVLSYAARL